MTQKFILIAYDISHDRRRTRLHNALLNYGTPVQYSVFECLLTQQAEKKMRREIAHIIRPRQDHVRYYTLCAACQIKIETSGGREVLGPPPPAIIVGGDDPGG